MEIKRAKAVTKEELQKVSPFLTHERFITKEQVDKFASLLAKKAGETAIDKFLTKNPEIFAAALHNFNTGHHGAMIIPKQQIRTAQKLKGMSGLIPDFLIGGKNSDGWNWWVVELKGSNQKLFSQKANKIFFDSEINKGICQLLEYIDFCSEQQAKLRDEFGLQEFREPFGLLIGGREEEVENDNKKQKIKAAWNRVNRGKLEIRTYDSMLRNTKELFEQYKKNGRIF